MNYGIYWPNLDVFIDVCGLPNQYQKKADIFTKLTVVMWCQIFYRKSAAAVGLWTGSGILKKKNLQHL